MYASYAIEDQEGKRSLAWNLTCFKTATFRATATSCKLSADDEVTFTQLSKPDVSISASAPNANGQVTFTVPYAFPNTGSRRLELLVDGVSITTATDLAPGGTWTSPPYPNACWKKAEVVATSCGQNGNPDHTDRAETLAMGYEPAITQLTMRRTGTSNGAGRYEVRFDYALVPGTKPWTARLELLPYTDIADNDHPGQDVLPLTTLAEPNGPIVINFSAAETSQLKIKATLTSCAGVKIREETLNCDPCDQSNAPVYYSDGNMLLYDGDPLPSVANHSLERTYNSHEQAVGLFGRGWTTLFDRRLSVHTATAGDTVALTTEANETIIFRRNGSAFVQTSPANRSAGTLTHDPVAGVYSYRAPGSPRLARFRASDGRLIAVRDAGTGQQADIAWDAAGRPATLTDSWTGLTWTLTVDAQRRVTSIAISGRPDLTWTYSYDAASNLQSVTAPGNATWRTYEYAGNRMTASRDALGNLIESHSYNADGQATSSVGAGDEIASIAYNEPVGRPDERLTVVTQSSGLATSYRMRTAGGAWRTVEITNGCSTCGTREATMVRDSLGRVIRRQNADGYVTVTTYSGTNVASVEAHLKPAICDPQTDPSRCRLGSDALASAVLAATAATTTTTYAYGDANWPEKATSISTASMLHPSGLRQQTFSYDSVSGALLSTTITGFTGTPAASAARTTQAALYDGVATAAFDPGGTFQSAWMSLPQPPRLLKSQDGPRADVQDVTSYVHYPVHTSVPALLRGRLAAVRNAAGHVTRIEAYDVFGNATRTVDANGVITELTTDTLGRVSASTLKGVAGCDTVTDPLCATDLTSTRVYAGAGPLQTEQRAGGGVTTYSYDARGRVRTISRGPSTSDLRERIEYSYDAGTGNKSLERILGFEAGAWVEMKRESYSYEPDGDLQVSTHGDGESIAYAYDADGRVTAIRDENHTVANTSYAYDPAGRLSKVTQTAPTPTGSITTSYAYDRHGNLTSVTDPVATRRRTRTTISASYWSKRARSRRRRPINTTRPATTPSPPRRTSRRRPGRTTR